MNSVRELRLVPPATVLRDCPAPPVQKANGNGHGNGHADDEGPLVPREVAVAASDCLPPAASRILEAVREKPGTTMWQFVGPPPLYSHTTLTKTVRLLVDHGLIEVRLIRLEKEGADGRPLVCHAKGLFPLENGAGNGEKTASDNRGS